MPDESPQSQMSTWTVSTIISVVASAVSVIALASTVIFTYWQRSTDRDRYYLELDRDKIKIVELIDKKEVALAIIILDYYEDRFESDPTFLNFVLALQAHIAGASGEITGNQPLPPSSDVARFIESLTPSYVRDELFSPDRRKFAELIAATAEKATTDERLTLAAQITDSLISGNDTAESARRYRVNLYVAVTMSLYPSQSISEESLAALIELRQSAEYKSDTTFRANVERAIARQSA